MTLFPSRRFDRVPRAKFDAITAALTRERDAALEKARDAADRADLRVEAGIDRIKRAAAMFDEDAKHIDRLKVDVKKGMTADQRRAVRDTLRDVAADATRDLEAGR